MVFQHDTIQNKYSSFYNGKIEATNKYNALLHFAVVFFVITFIAYLFRHTHVHFHVIIEFISIAIGWSAFLLVWNTTSIVKNSAILFIGIAYFFIGIINFSHAISYPGIEIIPDVNANVSTQLRIAGRAMEACSLLYISFILNKRIIPYIVLFIYTCITALGIITIFVWPVFPACYVENAGHTSFNNISECIICIIFLVASYCLWKNRNSFEHNLMMLLQGMIYLSLLSEIAFILYHDFYDINNHIGYYFNFFTIYLLYYAILQYGLNRPYFKLLHKFEDVTHALEYVKSQQDLILDHQSDYIILQNNKGTILWINQAACELVGLAKEEIIGKQYYELWCKDQRDVTECLVEKTTKSGKIESGTINTPDGKILDIRSCPIFDHEGEITQILNVARDITEETHNEQRYSYVLSTAIDGLWVINMKGIIL